MEAVLTRQAHANPVYGAYFADPFVWRHGQTYYAIGTGAAEANGSTLGKVFPLLQSPDFFQWSFASNALSRPQEAPGSTFWAPEVAYHEGLFYLYYSVGAGDKNHELRVAISDSPQGPYQDCGHSLLAPPECLFAIDPHPFRDRDGQWYLFFATDFLDEVDGFKPGTGLVMAPLRSMTELERPTRTVLRARHNWQRFEADRSMYGAMWDWHTLEGPFVVFRQGLYYCFYSAGRWENETYGVDYAVAPSLRGPWVDSGNETGARVLRTIPGLLFGPGHNSIVTGPDGADYIVYHAWDKRFQARQMHMDPLVWTSSGPRCSPSSAVDPVRAQGISAGAGKPAPGSP